MNEFEWRRQMRDLRQPLTPRRDLWAPSTPRWTTPSHSLQRRRPLETVDVGRWLIAASVALPLRLLAGGIGWHLQHTSAVCRSPATDGQHDSASTPTIGEMETG
jgi:hypothetical protein